LGRAHGPACVVSCASGIPKTASTASPTNVSTAPPWRSIAVRAASKYRLIAPEGLGTELLADRSRPGYVVEVQGHRPVCLPFADRRN
jgi:hypothetical protein